MDPDLTSDAFWTSDEVVVMRPSDLTPGNDPAGWAVGRETLAGHVLFRTSGTEGPAKWVALSRKSLLHSARAVNEHLEVTEKDIWAVALPCCHVGGFGIFARAYLSGSEVNVLAGHWCPGGFHEMLFEAGSTISALVPTQLYDLVSLGLPAPPSLRILLVGGDVLNHELERDARSLGWPVLKTYGMTECASQVATQLPGDSADALPVVLPIWEVARAEAGQLRVRGKALASGYVETKEDKGNWAWQPFTEDWFATRDLGEIVHGVDRPRLRVGGRAFHCVKIKGELVNLQNVRNSLAESLAEESRRLVTIAARTHARDGSELVLVAAGPEIDEELLRQWMADQPSLTRPIGIVRLAQIPRNDLGKLDEVGLKAMVERHAPNREDSVTRTREPLPSNDRRNL